MFLFKGILNQWFLHWIVCSPGGTSHGEKLEYLLLVFFLLNRNMGIVLISSCKKKSYHLYLLQVFCDLPRVVVVIKSGSEFNAHMQVWGMEGRTHSSRGCSSSKKFKNHFIE